MDALVVEGVRLLAEELAPLVAQVEEPVVLADHHVDGRLHVLQDLRAHIQLARAAELRQVAAVEHEVGLRDRAR